MDYGDCCGNHHNWFNHGMVSFYFPGPSFGVSFQEKELILFTLARTSLPPRLYLFVLPLCPFQIKIHIIVYHPQIF